MEYEWENGDDEVFKLVGFDASGVRRVWAADYTKEDAELACRAEAADYIQRRPDTGPIDGWRFVWR